MDDASDSPSSVPPCGWDGGGRAVCFSLAAVGRAVAGECSRSKLTVKTRHTGKGVTYRLIVAEFFCEEVLRRLQR